MENKNQLVGQAFGLCYKAARGAVVAGLDDDDATQLFALTLGQVRREIGNGVRGESGPLESAQVRMSKTLCGPGLTRDQAEQAMFEDACDNGESEPDAP